MRKFDVFKNSVEISWKDRSQVVEGCSVNTCDSDPLLIKSCDTLEEAIEEVNAFTTNISKLSGCLEEYFIVEEVYAEENVYDDDDSDYIVESLDVHAVSKMVIKVFDDDTNELLGTFNNWMQAEKFASDYDGETWIDY